MSNTTEKRKILLVCSDGKTMDAKPYFTESSVVQGYYEYELGDEIRVEIKSDIIYKVGEFCVGRTKIQNDPANDEMLVQKKLNAFNSEFRQHHQTDAIDLVIAAFDLEIKSLVDLMMEDVVGMFTKMTTDEIYDILSVNLKEYNYYKFELMVLQLDIAGWAFE